MVDFREVDNFGGIDADADKLLDRCFQDHPAYLAVRNRKRFLVIGRKGSGKTAIYRKLIGIRAHDVFGEGHSFAEYPWHYHNLQTAEAVPPSQQYIRSWEYLSLMTLAKILLNSDQSQPWCPEVFSDVQQIEEFVVDTYGERNPSVTNFFKPKTKLSLTGSLSFLWDMFSVGVEAKDVTVEHLPKIAYEFNQQMRLHVLRALNPEFEYFVCFDELDKNFQPGHGDYEAKLIGLILAARRLNQAATAAGKSLSVVVFLRDDIYRTLQFEDKNKITNADLVPVEWDQGGASRTLKELMEKRFSVVFSIPEKKSWEQVFDEEKEMPRRQTKYAHMCDRTFLRPRDMIKFCNEVLNARRHRGGDEGQFENADICYGAPSLIPAA